MFIAVIAVIAISASSDSGDDGGGDTSTALVSERADDPDIRKALTKGEYVVKEGDTLTAISEATGIDIDTLIELNPETDTTTLIPGRKIKLR